MIAALTEILPLLDQADEIYNSTADWEVKYALIFNLNLAGKIHDAGFNFKYYDPDTSYQEDVVAYYRALELFRASLGSLAGESPVEAAESGDW